jgi:hypothetical protein
MTYINFENGTPQMYPYGIIFINKDFSKVSIMKYQDDKDGADTSTRGWGAEDGLMISAPANNRKQALEISNELMGKYLQGYILK